MTKRNYYELPVLMSMTKAQIGWLKVHHLVTNGISIIYNTKLPITITFIKPQGYVVFCESFNQVKKLVDTGQFSPLVEAKDVRHVENHHLESR